MLRNLVPLTVLGAALAVTGCQKNAELEVAMVGVNAQEVRDLNIEPQEVRLHHTERGWYTISASDGEFDSTLLRSGMTARIGTAELPSGEYDRIQLVYLANVEGDPRALGDQTMRGDQAAVPEGQDPMARPGHDEELAQPEGQERDLESPDYGDEELAQPDGQERDLESPDYGDEQLGQQERERDPFAGEDREPIEGEREPVAGGDRERMERESQVGAQAEGDRVRMTETIDTRFCLQSGQDAELVLSIQPGEQQAQVQPGQRQPGRTGQQEGMTGQQRDLSVAGGEPVVEVRSAPPCTRG